MRPRLSRLRGVSAGISGPCTTCFGQFPKSVAPSGMCFAPSKCKVLMQEWTTVVPKMILGG